MTLHEFLRFGSAEPFRIHLEVIEQAFGVFGRRNPGGVLFHRDGDLPAGLHCGGKLGSDGRRHGGHLVGDTRLHEGLCVDEHLLHQTAPAILAMNCSKAVGSRASSLSVAARSLRLSRSSAPSVSETMSTEINMVVRHLTAELCFQPSDIDRMNAVDATWWLTD